MIDPLSLLWISGATFTMLALLRHWHAAVDNIRLLYGMRDDKHAPRATAAVMLLLVMAWPLILWEWYSNDSWPGDR